MRFTRPMRHSHLPATFVVLCWQVKPWRCQFQNSASWQFQWGPDFRFPRLGNCGGSFLMLGSQLKQCGLKLDILIPHHPTGAALQLFQQLGLWYSGGLAYSAPLQFFPTLCKPLIYVSNSFLLKTSLSRFCFLN